MEIVYTQALSVAGHVWVREYVIKRWRVGEVGERDGGIKNKVHNKFV